MGKYTLLVMTNAVEGAERAFNDWYDKRHLQDALRIPGFVAAQRFKMVGKPVAADPLYRFCALYEVETDDVDGMLADVLGRVGTDRLPMSDALAPQFYAVLYEAISPRVTAVP